MAIKVQNWKAEADSLDLESIDERIEYLTQLRDGKLTERRQEALDQIKEIMAANRLSPHDIADKPEPKRSPSAGRKMAPKYRDPANPENVWSGQGRAPKWMPENKEQWSDFKIE